jgi:serine protease Do
MRTILLGTLLLSAAANLAAAQQTRIVTTPRARVVVSNDREERDRPYLGITLGSGSKRDTLGILVESVTPGSPAEKAGLEEGNRIGAINGVSLKLTRDDIGDSEMANAMMNRLTRELRKGKVGDEVSLEVWTGGRYKTVKVKTAMAESVSPARRSRADEEERAVIGVSLSSTGSKRDAEGVFVSAVTEGGPAEKAGIVEGERIASINGVDLRVAKEDLGEPVVASAKVDRLQRELRKVKAGDAVELQVVSGGRTRSVKVTTVKATALPMESSFRFFDSDGGSMIRVPGSAMTLPRIPTPPRTPDAPAPPRVRIFRDFDGAGAGDVDVDVRAEVERALERLRVEMPTRMTLRRTIII